MKNWTVKRKASLVVHSIVVAIPFTISTVAALLFWDSWFHSWWLAAPIVASVELLALTGLVLAIVRIASPFQALRHLLPFISIVPMGYELYNQLSTQGNGGVVGGVITVLLTGILVAIARSCYHTIEGLFISPVEAAIESATATTHKMHELLAANDASNTTIQGALQQYGLVATQPSTEVAQLRAEMDTRFQQLQDGINQRFTGLRELLTEALEQPAVEVVKPAQLPETSATLETKRGKLPDVATLQQEVNTYGKPWVVEKYGVSRQGIDKKLKGAK